MATLSFQLLISVGVILVAVGVAWGDLRSRIGRIEKLVGNGTGSFLRHDEANILIRHADEQRDEFRERIERLERKTP